MVELCKTERFTSWLDELRDLRARRMVLVRLERMGLGNFGDVRPVGCGVSELRIDFGPGYRVYFVQAGVGIVVLLTGGTKATQSRDIKQAIAMAKNFQDIQ
jgi:putative addiction module killer protein